MKNFLIKCYEFLTSNPTDNLRNFILVLLYQLIHYFIGVIICYFIFNFKTDIYFIGLFFGTILEIINFKVIFELGKYYKKEKEKESKIIENKIKNEYCFK